MATATLLVFVFSAVVYVSWALTVTIPNPTYEFARGDNATVPCNFKPKKTSNQLVTIEWMARGAPDSDDDTVIQVFIINGTATTDVGSSFENRASLLYDVAKGFANLQLKNVAPTDTRVFSCHITIPGDPANPVSTKVVVLVAPSKPICNIQGKAEYYQNISLTCNSVEGTPTPTYQWTSYDLSNNLRPNPPKSTDVNGVLSLYNISADTTGYFICTSKNKVRSASCNVTLAVMQNSMNIASTAGIIGGCAAVAVILLIIIICCCCKKKQKEQEYMMRGEGEEHHTMVEYSDKSVEIKPERSANQRDQYEDQSEHDYEKRSDRYPDRHVDYDDRKTKSDDHPSDRYDDRRSDRYDDRRSDRNDDRRSDRNDDRYDDRRNDRYDDRRSDRNDDRRSDRYDDRYDDRRNDRYDDRRSDRNDDRRSDRYDDRRK